MNHPESASGMVPQEQEFLYFERIPVGHVTVIAGAPAVGKSTLGYRIAADAAVPTIFITTEESDTTVWRPRVEAAGADLSLMYHHPRQRFSRRPEDLERLKEVCAERAARLVIVDPLTNHLEASVYNDVAVRTVLEPYLDWIHEQRIALVFQVHVLRSINAKSHPLTAIPSGITSVAKAVYLFGDHPDSNASSDIRVLACADKFNFGQIPASMEFEYETRPVKVKMASTGRRQNRDFGRWHYRGETSVTAKTLLIRLAPETKERKSDRIARELLDLLKDGKMLVGQLHAHFKTLQPPISFRSVERVAAEMGVERSQDPADKRRWYWQLSSEYQAIADELTEPEDSVEIEEIDKPEIPETFPEEWNDDEGAA